MSGRRRTRSKTQFEPARQHLEPAHLLADETVGAIDLDAVGALLALLLWKTRFGRNVYITADVLNINGLIQAGTGTFDVTILAEKDGQFDYGDVPFTGQDLRSALNYRKEEGLPMDTVLLKRSEKQSVKDAHVVWIARLSVDLKFKAYVEEDGEINEIQTTTKKSD